MTASANAKESLLAYCRENDRYLDRSFCLTAAAHGKGKVRAPFIGLPKPLPKQLSGTGGRNYVLSIEFGVFLR